MTYSRIVILLMLFIMAFPIVYSAVYHDKAVYSLLSDEEKPADGEDGEKDGKDDVPKCFQNFFTYSIDNNADWNNQLLPLDNSAIPAEHFAKVQSPPPDTI